MGESAVGKGQLARSHQSPRPPKPLNMDAIRKKMQSLKAETEGLYSTIKRFEDLTKQYTATADQADCDIRDYGKKVQNLEIGFDETNDKLTKATESLEEKEKTFKEVESDVSALSRRIMLMEEESKKSEQTLADTVTKLATTSKEADTVLKAVKVVESKNMNNEVVIEDLDKNLRQTTKMASDNEQKLDELTRKLGVQEAELKGVEDELESVGENMKTLEMSSEKALEREEKLKDKILQLQNKFKVSEARFEYGEMNITKLNHRIDDIEDEIYREKLKIKRCADELNDTFDDMLEHY